MSINLYTGLPGGGKSYEVVSSVIVPAIKEGRRVVTNIKGLQIDKIKEKAGGDGEIIVVETERIAEPGFFPGEHEREGRIVQPGDLICLDEIWRYWPQSKEPPQEHIEFFRMHRHIVDDKGINCDVAIITQDPGDVHKTLKAVIETTFRMVKLRAIGRDKSYRVEIFPRTQTHRKAQRIQIKNYDKSIFALYSSYTGKGGNEQVIDKRVNILNSGFFKIVLPILIIIALFGAYKVYTFLNPPKAEEPKPKEKALAKQQAQDGTAAKGAGGPAEPSYRLTGIIETSANGVMFVLWDGRQGRLIKTQQYRITPDGWLVKYKGQWTDEYSGPVVPTRLATTTPPTTSIIPVNP